MTSETDQAIAHASEVLDRHRTRAVMARQRRGGEVVRRLARIAAADAAILIAAAVIGWIVPLGIGGALIVMAALIAATLALAIFPGSRPIAPEQLAAIPLKSLPGQTGRWLEAQRAALPAPAKSLVDAIGVRLDTLTPQVESLDDRIPAAAEIRKLVGEQLPGVLRDYGRVPAALRTVPRNGKTPDQQLAEALDLIDRQLGEVSGDLAAGDLDTLATRGRYLEIKYRDA